MKHLLLLALTLRLVTAYTPSIDETDSSPCIAASGYNICEGLERGEKLCAANWAPFWVKLNVPGYGACTNVDRMARKNGQKVDVLFKTKKEALQWGVKKLNVTKL